MAVQDHDFESLLNVNPEDVQPPVPLPAGSYLARIRTYEPTESSQKGTPGMVFYINPTEAMEDVDQDLLAEMDKPLKEKELRATYWLTENALIMLKGFLEDAGLDLSQYQTLAEAVADVQGGEIGIHVSHQASQQDSSRVFANIDDTFNPNS